MHPMLAHLRILDLTAELGAYAARLLASLGADVIRIEPPGPGAEADRATRLADRIGKRTLALDPASAADRARLSALLARADILFDDDAGLPAAFGLDRQDLAQAHPRLIAVTIAPHVEESELATEPCTDLTLLALSGIANIMGDPARPPLRLPGRQAYALAGCQGAIAALLALYSRNFSGLGQAAQVSAYQSAVLAGYRDPLVYEWTGRLGGRHGNLLVRGRSGVRQVWPCLDGFVTWSLIDNPPMVRAMVALLEAQGGAGSLADVAWESLRIADADPARIALWEHDLAAFFARFPRAELAAWSAARGLGLSPIASLADALAEPHWQQRGFWRQAICPETGTELTLPGPPFRSTAPLATALPPLGLADPATTDFLP